MTDLRGKDRRERWAGTAEGTPPHLLLLAAIGFLAAWTLAAAAVGLDPRLWILGATVPAAGLLTQQSLAHRAAVRADLGLRFLSPGGFRTVSALAASMLPSEAAMTPVEIARNMDRQLSLMASAGGKEIRGGLIALRLIPLLTARRPLSAMDPEACRSFIEGMLAGAKLRSLPDPIRSQIQALTKLARTTCSIAYYTDHRAQVKHGYTKYSERATAPPSPAPAAELEVERAPELSERITTDVAIIGSGAGGAILAYRLAESGRSVTLIERGPHVTRDQVSEDEAEMLGKLFGPGGAQVSRDFRFQVMQGMCVGGSTVVNNAVCFDLPDHVLARWNSDLGAGLDAGRLSDSFRTLRRFLGVRRQDDAPHSDSARRFVAGIEALGLDRPPNRFGVVEANISECVGCGLCNIGCAYGAKHSMSEFVLPQGQQRFGKRLRVVSEALAERIAVRHGRACAVECRDADGRRRVVEAETVVVSAGALHSSTLLQRSGLGRRLAGRSLHHNVAIPLMAEFDERLDCFEGLQISHFWQPPPERGFILESWAQPLGTYGTVLNGWFEDHFETMSSYRRLASAGVVVGTTDSSSWVRHSRLARRPTFAFKAGPRDVASLVRGTQQLGEIFLAAGARRLIPATFAGEPISSAAELARLPGQVHDGRDLVMSTAHPQGGNPIGTDPRRAVVDERFRVHGIENLHVCDASVFPSAIGVNPQLTVMALADYAAPLIA